MSMMFSNIKKNVSLNDLQVLAGFSFLVYIFRVENLSLPLIVVSTLFLALGISSSVHNAEVIAKRIGPSLGTLVLALSVTVIEVALILNLMQNESSPSSTLARDTVFAAIMIVTNGIAGISILLGGLKHKQLGFQPLGTSSLMAVLTTLSFITMVLPNFTTSTTGPTYSHAQLLFVSLFSLIIYISLVWAQTKTHKDFFESLTQEQFKKFEEVELVPSREKTVLSFFILILSLIVVVGFAKVLSPALSVAVDYVGAPQAAVGIIIALLVLAPETFAALNSAKTNQLQTSLNLALGSGAASIALTIPVVSIYSILAGQNLNLGLDGKGMSFLVLTFLVGSFTLGSGKTSALHGIVHLIILLSFIVFSFLP